MKQYCLIANFSDRDKIFVCNRLTLLYFKSCLTFPQNIIFQLIAYTCLAYISIVSPHQKHFYSLQGRIKPMCFDLCSLFHTDTK